MISAVSFGKYFLEKNPKLITVISPIYNYIFGRNDFLKENINWNKKRI